MEILFVRHAQSFGNKYKSSGYAWLHNRETPLTALGEEQALHMAGFMNEYLSDADKNKVLLISSPFERARQTADYISKESYLPSVRIMEEFREWDFGPLREMSKEQIQKEYAEILAAYNVAWEKTPLLARLPDGETGEEVKRRIETPLKELVSEAEARGIEKVVIVGHSMVSSLMRMILCSEGDETFNPKELKNAEILKLKGNLEGGYKSEGIIYKPQEQEQTRGLNKDSDTEIMDQRDMQLLLEAFARLSSKKQTPSTQP